MATLRSFGGFECGTFDELSDYDPACSIETTPAPPKSVETYVAKIPDPGPARAARYLQPFTFTANDNDYAIGFYIRFTTVNPSPFPDFFAMQDSAGNKHWKLQLRFSGAIRLYDANNGILGTSSNNTVAADTWHYFQILFTKSNFGNIRVDVDGETIFNLTGSTSDLEGSASAYMEPFFKGQGPNVIEAVDIYVPSWYVISGCSSWDDLPNDHEVVGPYQMAVNSATPDPGAGDDLDTGTWDDAAEVPFNDGNYVRYTTNQQGVVTTSSSAGGKTPGPYGDNRIAGDDNILGASWVLRWKALSGFGNAFHFLYGDTPSDQEDTDNTTSVYLGTSSVYVNHLIVTDDSSHVPDTSEYFQYGFYTLFAGIPIYTYLGDCACFILHEPPSWRGVTIGCGVGSKSKIVLVGTS